MAEKVTQFEFSEEWSGPSSELPDAIKRMMGKTKTSMREVSTDKLRDVQKPKPPTPISFKPLEPLKPLKPFKPFKPLE